MEWLRPRLKTAGIETSECALRILDCNSDINQGLHRVTYEFVISQGKLCRTDERGSLECAWSDREFSRASNLALHLLINYGHAFSFRFTKDDVSTSTLRVTVKPKIADTSAARPAFIRMSYPYARPLPAAAQGTTTLFDVLNPLAHATSSRESPECTIEDSEITKSVAHVLPARAYAHAQTAAPLPPSEMHIDSEDDEDEEWRLELSERQLAEFDDVQDDEKAFMMSWNRFINSCGVYGDLHLRRACFLYAKSGTGKHHEKQFMLHVLRMMEVDLMSRADAVECMNLLRAS